MFFFLLHLYARIFTTFYTRKNDIRTKSLIKLVKHWTFEFFVEYLIAKVEFGNIYISIFTMLKNAYNVYDIFQNFQLCPLQGTSTANKVYNARHVSQCSNSLSYYFYRAYSRL